MNATNTPTIKFQTDRVNPFINTTGCERSYFTLYFK
jgi:hypothetical protein